MAHPTRMFRAAGDEVDDLRAAKPDHLVSSKLQYEVWPAARGGRPVFVWDEQELADWASQVRVRPLPLADREKLGDPLVWVIEFDDEQARADFAARNGWTRNPTRSGVDDEAVADVPMLAESVPALSGALFGASVSLRYADALSFASFIHAGQLRKGDGRPVLYLNHLVRVSQRVHAHGGTEDQAVAALLHDAAEDQGGRAMLDLIRNRYGNGVADIVENCSDSLTGVDEAKLPWRDRKTHHVAWLSEEGDRQRATVPVSAADKLDNATGMTERFDAVGHEMWSRFKGGRVGTIWYQRAMQAALAGHGIHGELIDELGRQIDELVERAGRD